MHPSLHIVDIISHIWQCYPITSTPTTRSKHISSCKHTTTTNMWSNWMVYIQKHVEKTWFPIRNMIYRYLQCYKGWVFHDFPHRIDGRVSHGKSSPHPSRRPSHDSWGCWIGFLDLLCHAPCVTHYTKAYKSNKEQQQLQRKKIAAVEQRKKTKRTRTEEQRQPPPTSMMTRMRTTGCVNPKMSEKYITNAEQPERPQDNHPTFPGR